jgi:YidC/Oxa1 family membrane protein insertase
MRLYSEHRVNPMAGCLPMIIQIPIFFGLYRAILHLSQGKGPENASDYWLGSFLWLDSLAKADPWHVLPILAAIFQFIQTKMMRPANQGKITDPQQAMMNTMMNFMPLMVIFFGWTFASGPVIYWAAQSVYSVVQQWFITGWGSMLDWFPYLPELPEHRRLGYRAPRPMDEVVVVSGEGGPKQRGFMGWMNRKMEEAQGLSGAGATATSAADAPKPKGTRPVKKDSPAGRAQRQAEKAAQEVVVTGANGGANPSRPAGSAPIVPRKSRPTAPKRDEKAGSNGE